MSKQKEQSIENIVNSFRRMSPEAKKRGLKLLEEMAERLRAHHDSLNPADWIEDNFYVSKPPDSLTK